MRIETAFELEQSVKIKATQVYGKIIGFWLGYQHKECMYQVEYAASTGELTDRYFLLHELET